MTCPRSNRSPAPSAATSTLESLACPECGHVHAHRKHLFKTRRYYRRLILGTLLLLVALHCHTGPEVQYRRETLGEKWWESVVPTTVWIVMLPYLEDERVGFLDGRVYPPAPPGRSSPHIFFTLFGPTHGEGLFGDLFEEWRPPPDRSNALSDWQCRLLASAVVRRFERTPMSGSPSAPSIHAQPREIAVNWVIEMRGQVDVLDQLITLSGDSDLTVRSKSLLALGGETRIDRVLPILLKSLNDPDEDVRLSVARVLGRFGPKASAAVPALMDAIVDPSNNINLKLEFHNNFNNVSSPGQTSLRAVMVLALLRIDPAKGIPIVTGEMRFSQGVYQAALESSIKDRVDPAFIWPLAIHASLADDESFQEFIASEADPSKPTHERAARFLMKALSSEDGDEQGTARRIIENMDAQVPLMHWAAQQDDIDINEEFIGLMITLGDKANSLTHTVARKMLRDPARYRGQIMDMLAHTGPPSKEVIAVLREATNHEDEAVREMAKFTLEQIQP